MDEEEVPGRPRSPNIFDDMDPLEALIINNEDRLEADDSDSEVRTSGQFDFENHKNTLLEVDSDNSDVDSDEVEISCDNLKVTSYETDYNSVYSLFGNPDVTVSEIFSGKSNKQQFSEAETTPSVDNTEQISKPVDDSPTESYKDNIQINFNPTLFHDIDKCPNPFVIKERKFRCTVGHCTRSFLHQGTFIRHQQMHGTKFRCEVCMKEFSEEESLLDHITLKKHVQPIFECSFISCDKKFTYKNSLLRHEKTHIIPFELSCRECEKKFADKCSLSKHLVSHSSVRPYQCLTCQKTYKTISDINNHNKVHHSNFGKFVCDNCEMEFCRKDNLIRHRKGHEGEVTVHVCKMCNVRFQYGRGLTLHMMKCHPIAYEKRKAILRKIPNKKIWKIHNSIFSFKPSVVAKH